VIDSPLCDRRSSSGATTPRSASPTGSSASAGGNVAVPGPRDNALQYIDARDLGEFVVTLAANSTLGASTRRPLPPGRFYDVIQTISEQISPSDTRLVEISPRHIKSHISIRDSPLVGIEERDRPRRRPAKAVAAGLTFRGLSESVEDVIDWWVTTRPLRGG